MKNVEVEDGELLLESDEGHYAIIPKKDRKKIMDMINGKCDDCINEYIKTLPRDKDYAEDGTLISENQNMFNLNLNNNNPNVKKEEVYSKKQYQEDLKNNYLSYLEKNKYKTPVLPGVTDVNNMNCIHGMCGVISETTGKKFKQKYTGNMTFQDNLKNENFYRVDPTIDGFEIGDIIQYADPKSSPNSRFEGKVTPKNMNDLVPVHAVLIVDSYVKNGIKYYKVLNNHGSDYSEIQEITGTDLLGRRLNGFGGHKTILVNRYDPDKIKELNETSEKERQILEGNNPFAKEYENAKFEKLKDLKFTDEEFWGKRQRKDETPYVFKGKEIPEKVAENVKRLILNDSNLNQVYSTLGKGSNIPKKLFDKMIESQIGIMGQETEYDTDMLFHKKLVPDSALPFARSVSKSLRKEDNWKKDYWQKNADNVQSEFNSYDEFLDSFEKDQVLTREEREYIIDHAPRSKGPFQQKELSPRGRYYKFNLDDETVGGYDYFQASLALQVDNYHKLKKKFPTRSDDELLELSILMHNSPNKALNDRFVNYYLKNKDINYVNSVKEKMFTTFDHDQNNNVNINQNNQQQNNQQQNNQLPTNNFTNLNDTTNPLRLLNIPNQLIQN